MAATTTVPTSAGPTPEQEKKLAQLSELDDRIAAQEAKVAKTPNPRLKQKLAELLSALQRERKAIHEQLVAEGLAL